MAKKEAAKNKKGASKKPTEAKKVSAAPPEAESGSFNPVEFAMSAKDELSKVVWPSRQQLISESAAVLLMVSVSAGVIYFADKALSWASTQVFG